MSNYYLSQSITNLPSAAVPLFRPWPSPKIHNKMHHLIGKKQIHYIPLILWGAHPTFLLFSTVHYIRFSEQSLFCFHNSAVHCVGRYSGRTVMSLNWTHETSNWLTTVSENLMPLASLWFLSDRTSNLNCLNIFTLCRHALCCLNFLWPEGTGGYRQGRVREDKGGDLLTFSYTLWNDNKHIFNKVWQSHLAMCRQIWLKVRTCVGDTAHVLYISVFEVVQ